MGLLEDRILRIIELRQEGADDSEIGSELGIEPSLVCKYEDSTKNAIREIVKRGYIGLEIIAEKIELSPIATGLFVSYHRIDIKKHASYKPREERIEEIKKLNAEGKSAKEIAKELKLKVGTVWLYARQEGIKFAFQRKSKQERIEEIRKLVENNQVQIEQGELYLEDIAEELGRSALYIYQRYRKDLKLPDFRNPHERISKPRKNLIRDELIHQGLTLEEISKREEEITGKRISRQRVSQYVIGTNQKENWERIKENKKIEEEKRQELLSIISGQIMSSAREKLNENEKWAYDKCEEYYAKKKFRKIGFYDRLFNVFYEYKKAENKNEKPSLEELGKRTGVIFTHVGRILKDVGLEPFFGAREKHNVPEGKKQAIERAVAIPMNSVDIAYFLKIPFWNVQQYFNRHSERKNKRPVLKPIPSVKNYRRASEIYQAIAPENEKGCDFTKEKTIEALGISSKTFDYAIEHRREFEGAIINCLRTLYPDKEITKPWRDFKS